MHTLKISNFRCFYQEQTARFAPLTILVGENSTGKTSLLEIFEIIWSTAAMTRRTSYSNAWVSFGVFDDMISRLAQTDQSNPKYTASIDYGLSAGFETDDKYSFKASFQNHRGMSWISNITITNSSKSVSLYLDALEDKATRISIKTSSQNLFTIANVKNNIGIDVLAKDLDFLLHIAYRQLEGEHYLSQSSTDSNERNLNAKERRFLINLIEAHMQKLQKFSRPTQINPIGPIRTKPERRFYEGVATNQGLEGKHAPQVLAGLSRTQDNWSTIREKFNSFGKKSGLFEDLCIKFHGSSEDSPFDVLFKTSSQGDKEGLHSQLEMINWHRPTNLGFGVSQVLPIIIELYANTTDKIVLMQQPEVHLHPRAQAELGSALCEIAGPRCMLFVETHSDYLLDRVRINVRKGIGNVRAKDVSILFCKRVGEMAKIYSMKLDDYGNIVDAPDEYMDFFMREGNELLGLS